MISAKVAGGAPPAPAHSSAGPHPPVSQVKRPPGGAVGSVEGVVWQAVRPQKRPPQSGGSVRMRELPGRSWKPPFSRRRWPGLDWMPGQMENGHRLVMVRVVGAGSEGGAKGVTVGGGGVRVGSTVGGARGVG